MCTAVNRGRNILEISQSAKWQTRDVSARGAWGELRMDPAEMHRIEAATGFDDWTDPQLSAIYWGVRGRCADIVSQAVAIYRRRHGLSQAVDGPVAR